MQETTTPEATTTTPPSTTPVEVANPIDNGLPSDLANPSSGDPRLEFLRKILSKIREEAEKAGIDGTMQVSVMRVDQPDLSQVQVSVLKMHGFMSISSHHTPLYLIVLLHSKSHHST
ncbi:unnamed protein product [Anisakis simplex]|uniref:Uncharacterized protein n=1 Tax=Anisakis simplex TaxID=6269 RepID=A0A0M3JMX8_ANISI|nr:unnamed protein product [Anisakis simplex]